jgi:hypothetical protein
MRFSGLRDDDADGAEGGEAPGGRRVSASPEPATRAAGVGVEERVRGRMADEASLSGFLAMRVMRRGWGAAGVGVGGADMVMVVGAGDERRRATRLDRVIYAGASRARAPIPVLRSDELDELRELLDRD